MSETIQNIMVIANICSMTICFAIGFLCNEVGAK